MLASFNWLDYTVLSVYILFVLGIATLFVKEQHNLTDFFMASRKMPWWAVGCSILATLLSAISITGVPAEFWQNGLRTFGAFIIMLAVVPLAIFLFIKTFSGLQLVTAYEYLEKRFSLTVRLVGSVLFMLYRGCYIGIVMYASAVVVKPAFGGQIDESWLIIGIGLFSLAFAVLGGMKAIIWTDVIQLFVIYGGIAWMLVSMVINTDGGFGGMWQVAADHGKDFSYLEKGSGYWSFSLFEQTTLWGVVLMYIFIELAGQGTDQLTVQRYLTTRSAKASARSLWTYALMAIPVIMLLWLISIAMFAFFKQNPDALDESIKPDGLLPYYIATQVPHGISGLFIAAILAAVISTVDSGMNCLATAAMTDFHLRFTKTPLTDAQKVKWARLWTVFWGVATTVLSLIIYQTARENIARTVASVIGSFSGPLLGIFLLGVLSRRANTAGVGLGAVMGLGLTLWANYGWTITGPDGEQVHISFAWPVVIGSVSTCVIGYAASLFFEPPSEDKLKNLTCWTR
jgi:SSS family transporter